MYIYATHVKGTSTEVYLDFVLFFAATMIAEMIRINSINKTSLQQYHLLLNLQSILLVYDYMEARTHMHI